MSSQEELWRIDAVQLAGMIRRGEVTSTAVVESVLGQMERLDGAVNAVTLRIDEEALAAAKEADEAVARGDLLGPLHGVPYTAKCLTHTKGHVTTRGSHAFANNVSDRDDLVVQRLRAAGAILAGKTNSPDHGCKGVTDNLLHGPTRNPWNLDVNPGGSSGGASAAVAAGMGPIAQGGDFAGSIRIPASFCGLVGHKPSTGRIPLVPNNVIFHPVVSAISPIARTVADTALMLDVMAGPDARDPRSLADGEQDFLEAVTGELSIKGLRIGYSPDLGFVPVDQEVRRSCREALDVLADLGAEVTEIDVDFSDSLEPYRLLNSNRRAAQMRPYFEEYRDRLDPLLWQRVEVSDGATATDVGLAEIAQSAVYLRVWELMERFDVIMTPTTPVAPFPIGMDYPESIDGVPIENQFEQLGLTFVFNLTGHPAVSVPAGWTDEGLPVGLQIVGPWRDDKRVLRVAAAFEEARPWAQRWPDLVTTG